MRLLLFYLKLYLRVGRCMKTEPNKHLIDEQWHKKTAVLIAISKRLKG